MSWTPHDLPHLVEIFATEAEREAEILGDTAQSFEKTSTLRPVIELGERQKLMAEMARGAELNWLDSDVCELVRNSAETVPSWSPSAAMPFPSGLIAFEDQVMTAPENQEDGARDVNVDAILWLLHGAKVFIAALSLKRGGARPGTSKLAELIERAMPGAILPPARTSPLGELFTLTIDFDSIQGDDVAVSPERSDPEASRTVRAYSSSAEELLCVLGSVWLLMGQPRVVEEGENVVETVRRTSRSTVGSQGRRVRHRVIVSVRRLSPEAISAHGGGRGRATSRWWVRGHWRQQPWGKGRSLRKPVYIQPHTAGARDAAEPKPDDRPTVRVWRE